MQEAVAGPAGDMNTPSPKQVLRKTYFVREAEREAFDEQMRAAQVKLAPAHTPEKDLPRIPGIPLQLDGALACACMQAHMHAQAPAQVHTHKQAHEQQAPCTHR